ncbi:MAG: CapA family protein [Chloroflexota bacterium]
MALRFSQGYGAIVPYQSQLGHATKDPGADLVFGHHMNVLQGIAPYRGKVIAYSMGNFALDLSLSGFFGLQTQKESPSS